MRSERMGSLKKEIQKILRLSDEEIDERLSRAVSALKRNKSAKKA